MLKGRHLLFVSVVAILTSCQKEINDSITQNGSPLLVKTVQKTGSDSVVVEYLYDSGKRLVLVKTTGMMNGNDRSNEIKIYRQSNGAITKTVEKAAYLLTTGVDSIVINFSYDQASDKYIFSKFSVTSFGITVNDSTHYDYDASGRLIRDNHFQTITGFPLTQKYKQEYIYTASGNIDSVKNYSEDPISGVSSISYTIDYSYDNMVNPLSLNNDAVILNLFSLAGPNNSTMLKADYPGSTSLNYTATSVLIYNSDNTPASAANTEIPSGNTSSTVYYYQ